MEIPLINQVFIFLINLIGLWLALWVYLTNRKSKLNKTFSLMTILILFWVTFGYLSDLSSQAHLALIWIKLGFGAVFLFFIAAYFFTIFFPREEKRCLILDKAILSAGTILFLASIFTDLFIKDIEFKEWGTNPIFGKGSAVFYGVVVFLTFLIIGQLLRKYFNLSQKERLRVQYFLIGVFVFALSNLIFNVAFPLWRESIQYYQFGSYSAIFLLGFAAYAIVKKELFGIKVVLTSLLVGLIAILLLLDALIFTTNLTLQLFKALILIIFIYFGYLLINSVFEEIKRREEIERLSRAKSEFISIASHQLRSPLTAIKGYISMLLEGTYGELTERTKKPIENVSQSSERLIKLVNDLLSISRIEAGKIEMKLEKTSLEDIISEVVEELMIEAKNKNIYLKWEKPKKTLPETLLDKDKIRQVLSNVVDNAIRYTKKGGVNIKLKPQNSKLKIEVIDTGAGMTHEELDKMFESFSRGVAGTRLYTEGVGLGLYISRKFLEMHNGKIWAESKGRNKGSTFHIEIPIK